MRQWTALIKLEKSIGFACRYFFSRLSVVLCGLVLSSVNLVPGELRAQNNLETKIRAEVILPPIEVTTTRSEKMIVDIPSAISFLDLNEIAKGLPQLSLEEALTPVPGLFFQNQFNSAQDLRVSIRGFGSRSAFGVRGVKILVDGIPLTLPDGQTQMDSIDPGIIDSVEVLRGPSSSLYGNASGGVISIKTKEGSRSGFESDTRLLLGSFGLEKYQIQSGGTFGLLNYNFYASHLQRDGYRDHSATENTLVHGKLGWKPDYDSSWTFSLRHLFSPEAEDPGALTEQQADLNPKSARSQNVIFDAGEQVENTQIGLSYEKELSSSQEIFLTAHLNNRVFENKLPFTAGGTVEFERWAPGLGARTVINNRLMDKPIRWIAGADLSFQRDDRKRFDNNNGVKGSQTLDRIETVYSIGPYLRTEWQWSPFIELVAGIRYDHVGFDLRDEFLSDGDQSGSRTLSEWSGTLGTVFHFHDSLHGYANLATVFEVPTATELANDPSGGSGFNQNLGSQQSVNYEIGVKGKNQNELEYDIGLFVIQSWNELIPFEISTFPGRTFYKNAGQSRRIGIESAINYRPIEGVGTSLSYTFSDFRFIRFDDNGSDQSGNFIPGMPEHRIVAHVQANSGNGWFAKGEIQYVSSFFVNDDNTVDNPSYSTNRFSIGRNKSVGRYQVSGFLGLENIFNQPYNANTRINATGGRYFEPGQPFTLFGGVSLIFPTKPEN